MTWFLRRLDSSNLFGLASMLLQSLAWPSAAVLIAAMFRAEVRLVLERIVRLKYHDFEAQFHRDLLRSEGLAQPPAPRRLLDLPSESRRVFHELDEAPARPTRPGPRASIEGAWSELSAAADRAAGTVGTDPTPTLVERGLLAGPDLLLFDRLSRLHAQVAEATGWGPSSKDADRFAGLARPLAIRLGQSMTPRVVSTDRT